jgi:hypothetical protein
MMYDAVLKSTIEEIKAEMRRSDSELGKLFKGEDDEEGGASDEDDEDGAKKPKAKKPASTDEEVGAVLNAVFDKDGNIKNQGMDDATLSELSAALGPYIQRLEMLLTDPVGDDFGSKYFGELNPNFVSKKVRKVIERIKLSFETKPWKPGGEYWKPSPADDDSVVLPDACDFNGKRYVLLPPEEAKGNPKLYYAHYISNIEPDKDPRWKEEMHGKVIVFCRYTRSVNAIYEALKRTAPEYAKASVIFHGEVEGDKWAGLDAFKATPIDPTLKAPAQILIANEQAISEGHNLQMASRLIRVEAPWAPGELDQAAARIFRPDPSGKYGREHIYLDWILTDRTLEVAKMGRLISKMVTKAQFDEANNPHYDSLKDIQLEMKSMSIDALQERSTLADIKEYTDAYGQLAMLVGREFRQMRETKTAKMFDIEPEPMFDDAKIIPFVPYVPNMAVPDRNNLGLIVLNEWLQDTSNGDVQFVLQNVKENLKGRYVHTERGNGVIEGVRVTSATGRITSVSVALDNGDKLSWEPSMIYMSPKLTPESMKKLPKAPKATEKQKRALEVEKERAHKRAEKEDKKRAPRMKREMTELQKLKQIENLGKLAREGKKPAGLKPATPKPIKPVPKANMDVDLFPAVINGSIALEAFPADAKTDLTRLGMVGVTEYAYVKITSYGVFTGVMDWIESKFYVKKPTWKRLEDLHDSFDGTGKRAKFDIDQASVEDFKNFILLYKGKGKHTMAATKTETPNGKPELKVYPLVIGTNLYIACDLPTNPAIRRYIHKPLPNVTKEMFNIAGDTSDGTGKAYYKFGATNSVKELKKMAQAVVDAGYNWTNKASFDSDLEALKKNHGLTR